MKIRHLILGLAAAAATVVSLQASAEMGREEGLALAQQSGCLACHSIEKKIVGPAWQDVAARYKGNAGARDQLIVKVKAGGKGSWTEVTGGVPMPPYSPRVSDENIAALVDFVLSL
ncbi:MAG: c-type cytochrome [Gammaproteobacteria bacterium]|nr:c-type cytochrome [Gammaproteobacteria bacterium]